jgi:NADH-quinone oxidoreductase subunit H
MIYKEIFYFLIFPGFLFTVLTGSLVAALNRKVSARFQFRVGPPWHQSITDILKLFGKETILIKHSFIPIYIAAPLMAVAVAMLGSLAMGTAAFLKVDLAGDLLFFVYLLLIFTVSIIIGGFSSRNVYAGFGSGREINLLIAYELPFFLSILIPIIKTGFILKITGILDWQAAHGAIIGSASGFIGFAVMILCIQAKMGLTPFDVSEAETELVGGFLTEYSGPLLGCWKIAYNMLYVILPLTAVVLFLGGITGSTWTGTLLGILKYLGVVILMVIIRNTNPRLRINSIIRFFWKPLAFIALLGVILAVIGV